jgi:hypothetical protein
VSEKVELSSSSDDDDSSDGDPDFSSDNGDSCEAEQGCSSTNKQNRWSALEEQRLLACNKTGSGSSQAGLRPQYARAGPWYSTESNKLPPTGGQAAAQDLWAYLLRTNIR